MRRRSPRTRDDYDDDDDDVEKRTYAKIIMHNKTLNVPIPICCKRIATLDQPLATTLPKIRPQKLLIASRWSAATVRVHLLDLIDMSATFREENYAPNERTAAARDGTPRHASVCT